MTLALAICLGRVAPFYNLVLVFIVLILFIKLFSIKNKKVFLKPWKFIFLAVIIYVVEEGLTVLIDVGLVDTKLSVLLFPLMEMVMLVLFIYMLLLQKEHIKQNEQ